MNNGNMAYAQNAETLVRLDNVLIDKVEVIAASGTSKARAKGRLVQYNANGNIQWSKFFTTWTCITAVETAANGNSVDPVVGVVEQVTSEEGDLGSDSSDMQERKRISYNRTFTASGYFTRTKSKKDGNWYENLVLVTLSPTE